LAIPIALFGLAMGSMYFHYFVKKDNESVINRFSMAVFPLLLVSFIVFFIITNQFFYEIHAVYNQLGKSIAKLLVYSIMFIPAYFVFGALLSNYFTSYSDRIGKLYFFDLSGAALGCLITPLLFTYTDLPIVISALLASSVLLYFNMTFRYKKQIIAAAVVVFAVSQVLSFNGIIFKERPDIRILARTLMRTSSSDELEVVSSVWNELTRTTVIRRKRVHRERGVRPAIVVQDDGMSNVRFQEYNKQLSKERLNHITLHHSIAFEAGLKPENILVMFAGVGKDMVLLDLLGKGGAGITGVELNPDVVSAATDSNMA
jgi:hypothetical protein